MRKGWDAIRDYEALARFPPWVTGRFYQNTYCTGFDLSGTNQSLLSAAAIYVPNPEGVIITSIGVEVTTGGTASLARFGIYSSDDQGRPFKLLLDSGQVATTSTGFQAATVSFPLRQGWYWLVDAHNATVSATVRRCAAGWSKLAIGFSNVLETNAAIMAYTAISDSNVIAYIVRDGLPGHYPIWSNANPIFGQPNRIMVGI